MTQESIKTRPSHGLKNALSAGGAVLFMMLISIFLGDVLIYPIVLFHTTVIQIAGPLLIGAFVVLTIRSLWIYTRQEKVNFQNNPALNNKVFLPFLLQRMFGRIFRFSAILIFVTALFLLMVALVLLNTRFMF